MRGYCALSFFPAPSGCLSTTSFLSIKCPSPLFQLGIEKLRRKTVRNMWINCIQLMWSVECCCIALFREPIKWLAFDIQTHVSVLHADQFHISVFRKIDFVRFTAKRKRNTLKGAVKGSLRKKQFVQQREMPKKTMSGKRADHSFLCSSKM